MTREERFTWFRLELVMEPNRFVQTYRVENEKLASFPELYGWILDKMTGKLDESIQHSKGER